RVNVFTLLDGKEMVTYDVVDVFVSIIQKMLKLVPYPFKMRASITRPLALCLSKSDDTAEEALGMVGVAAQTVHDVEIVLMPIILNGHFHLLVLDNRKHEYTHYSSLQSEEYDKDAHDIVSFLVEYRGNIVLVNIKLYLFTADTIRYLRRDVTWRGGDGLLPIGARQGRSKATIRFDDNRVPSACWSGSGNGTTITRECADEINK
ncbi:hypothetical protein, partial [Bartonella sp. MR168JLCBS]|uniref:hypothetical protein n=1 Tax=Bartonella sp. MR168JLCBS TaxID=3243556 RepID=UPI0035CFAE35